jgi:branched-chain amino acid aminotransferase
MRVVGPGHATETSSGEAELACLDGELMSSEAAQIPATDEGLLRGDGVFEVVRLYEGRPFGLEQHLERMVRSASNLRLPLDRAGVEGDVRSLLGAAQPGDALLRVLVTRGGRRVALLEPLPEMPRAWACDVCAHARARRNQVALLRRQHARQPPGP